MSATINAQEQPISAQDSACIAAPDSDSIAPANVPKKVSSSRQRKSYSHNRSRKSTNKSSSCTVSIRNLNKLVSESEFKKAVETICGDQITIKSTRISYAGPNPTGKASVVFNTPEDAIKALSLLDGSTIREQKIMCSNLSPQSKNPKKTTPETKRKDPLTEELNRLKAKFPVNFSLKSEGQDHSVTFNMTPSDPDFPFDIDSFEILITIPQSYPFTPCQLQVLNKDIPSVLKRSITDQISERAKTKFIGKPMLVGLMNFLDENLDVLLIDKKLTQLHQLKQSGFELIAPKKPTSSSEIVEERKKGDITIEEYLNELASQRHEGRGEVYAVNKTIEERRVDQVNNCPNITRNKGTQILAEKVVLKGTGTLECITLRISVVCENCKRHIDVAFSETQPIQSLDCPKCQMAISVTFRKNFLHEQGNIIGYLDISGSCCTPFDYYPSDFRAACLECGSQTSISGITFDSNTTTCKSCFSKITTMIDGVKFKKIKRVSNPVSVEKTKKKDTLQGGKPLPNYGACEHFRKSKRWMRFPCCYKLFPCDICHEEAKMDHEMIWATRMVCGFCSKEQTFANRSCISCGQDVSGTGGSSHFWEGGAGCRNKVSMDRNDPHKFKNSEKKTHSSKMKRVGPKKTSEKKKK